MTTFIIIILAICLTIQYVVALVKEHFWLAIFFTAEIYRRQFGGTTTPENYGVYMQAILLRDPLIYVDYTSMPYKVYRHKNFFEKLVDKIGNR